MGDDQINWVAAVQATVIALGLAWLLQLFLFPGVAVVLSLTTALAWREYRTKNRVDMAVIPVTIALALGVAQVFPDEARGFIALLFVVIGALVVLQLRKLRPHAGG